MSYTAYETIDEDISITRDGPTATVTVLAPYDEAIRFGQTQVGGVRTILGIPIFFIGAAYARIPGLFCNSAKIKPLGSYDADNLDFSVARLTLTFGKLDQQQDDESAEEIGDVSYSVSGQELVLPRTVFKTGSPGGDPLGDDGPLPIKIIPQIELTVSFKFKPELDASEWADFVGKVNSSTFYGHGSETVMFNNVNTKRSLSSDGTSVWQHDYKFTVQPNGWNKYWQPSPGQWVDLYPKQYETADLNDIL